MIGADLFAGAGGLSLGAELAGIKVHSAVESDLHAATTYSHNFSKTVVNLVDIRAIKHAVISAKKEQTVIFGGPPCQGFSTSNQRTRSADNPSNWLFEEFARVAKLSRPDWVLFENVRGILETEGGFFLERLMHSLKRSGYTIWYGVLDASDYGVPQHRSRLFVVGSLHGIQLQFPHSTGEKYITVDDAISDLPSLENGAAYGWREYACPPKSQYTRTMRGRRNKAPNHLVTKNAPHIIERFHHVPQGGNWRNIPVRMMRNYADRTRCHTGIYHRLKADEPSIVLGNYRKNMLIHPIEHRGLSVREAARLQSFPDWFEFRGSIGFQQQQVGNAVPPLLAKAVFDMIMKTDI